MKLLKNNRLWLTLILLVTVLVYGRSLRNGFAVDDYPAILYNEHVSGGMANTGEIIRNSFYHGYDQREEANEYRPLSSLFYALQTDLFGTKKAVYWHLVNLLLYLGIVILVFAWVSRFTSGRVALITTALFALVPVHSEVVLNVKAQDDLLMGLLIFAALYFWSGTKDRLTSGLSLLFFTLALFCKEGAVPLVLLFPAVAYLQSGKVSQANALFLIPLALYFSVRLALIDPVNEVDVTNNALAYADNYAVRSAMGFEFFLRYLGKLLLPLELSWDYSFRHFALHGWMNLLSISGLLLFLLLLVPVLRAWKKPTIPAFALFLFLVSIGLYLHLVVLLEATFAERFLFVPALGLALFAGYYAAKKQWAPYLAAGICLAYGIKDFQRTPDWKDNLTLFRADIGKVPESIRANSALAYSLYEEAIRKDPPTEAMLEESAALYRKAINLYGNDANTWYNYGMCNLAMGDYTMAELCFKECLRIRPVHSPAFNNLGNIEYLKGEHPRAKEYYRSAVASDPENAEAWSNWGAEFLLSRDNDSAFYALKKAVQLDPENENARYNLNIARKRLGRNP